MDERFQGRPYRHLWAVAGEPYADDPYFTQLVHMDLARGETRRDFSPDLPGEAVFVPLSEDAAEGDGYVLTVVYRTEHHRSDLYVLDAQTLRTVCRLELPHHVPMGFHGTWVEADAPAPPESADA
jgi:carotenoid cleavage dioxygenase-like enzyme